MDDDQIIAQRISGKSVGAIAKAAGVSVAEINCAIDAWAAEVILDQLRKRSLCLDLERLDQLTEVFYRRAVDDADVQCGLLVAKLIERRGVMLGLAAPQQAVLQIVDNVSSPKETSIDRIEAAIEELAGPGPRGPDPAAH